jgi:hypothetical protein
MNDTQENSSDIDGNAMRKDISKTWGQLQLLRMNSPEFRFRIKVFWDNVFALGVTL